MFLRKGDVFSVEIAEIFRKTARGQRLAGLALAGFVTATAVTLVYRWVE